MPSNALARSRKSRRGTELVCEWVFRPLAHPLVLVFARLRVPPPVVVVAAGAAGLAAAVELGHGSLVVAALLVQLKTLLDNADGQLARLTGRTSAFRPLPRLGGRPARERSALRRVRLDDRQPGACARRLPRSDERAQPQLQRRAAVTRGGCRARGGRRPRDGGFAPDLRRRLRRRRTGWPRPSSRVGRRSRARSPSPCSPIWACRRSSQRLVS